MPAILKSVPWIAANHSQPRNRPALGPVYIHLVQRTAATRLIMGAGVGHFSLARYGDAASIALEHKAQRTVSHLFDITPHHL
jgi:hypothetical protein